MPANRNTGALGLVIVIQLLAVAWLLGLIWLKFDFPKPYAYLLVLLPTATLIACGIVIGARYLREPLARIWHSLMKKMIFLMRSVGHD